MLVKSPACSAGSSCAASSNSCSLARTAASPKPSCSEVLAAAAVLGGHARGAGDQRRRDRALAITFTLDARRAHRGTVTPGVALAALLTRRLARRLARAVLAPHAQARQTPQHLDVVFGQVDRHTALQASRQQHRTVADADQATHRQAHRVEEFSHLAIAPLADHDAVPAVRAFATTVLDAQQLRRLAVDRHAGKQLVLVFVGQRAQHAHRVLALDAETRVHQPVGELADVVNSSRPSVLDVQPPDRLPLAVRQTRQAAEHRGPPSGSSSVQTSPTGLW